MLRSPTLSRRTFLCSTGQAALAASLTSAAGPAFATTPPHSLHIGTRVLEVGGKPATVFGVTDAQGRPGLSLDREDGFDVRVTNESSEETVIHWHGLTPPFGMDGNMLSQSPIPPGGFQDYTFDLDLAGTNWLHSHHGLQEAQLMAAPLIIRDSEDRAADRQDVVMMLHDFSFTPPEEILSTLTGGGATHIGSGMAAMSSGMMRMGQNGMAGMDHGQMQMGGMAGMDHSAMPMDGMMQMDLNDIAFDAYLANDRDLTDPEVVPVEPGGRVRLRIINAASSTNFWIDLGAVPGTLMAVDGLPVWPLRGTRFEIAMAQRLDIEIDLPEAAAVPILAQREGDRARTGIVLAPKGAAVAKIDPLAGKEAPPVLLALERRLSATNPLANRAVTRRMTVDLTGDMMGYIWGMNGLTYENRQPLQVAVGDRVEIVLRNMTMMSHPMHLHGHHFQITGIGHARLSGAMRDTVLVPAMESVIIAFDADNPGDWPFHCHNLYHMAAGMMTTVRYV